MKKEEIIEQKQKAEKAKILKDDRNREVKKRKRKWKLIRIDT